ncbi:MAG: hypothetical protein HIU91_04510 [Acidobacteria bacterium]|nr:hypothetical protein [Acidobacteriota bacterium]
MKRILPVFVSIVTCVCLLLATERRAMAYVDPGSGLLALQSIASMFAAAAFFLRRRIMAVFSRKKPVTNTPSPVSPRKEDSRHAA